MKTLFKISVLMLITSLQINAQIKEVYNKSFNAENLKTLVLDLEGTYVQIEPSDDNKVHFNYSVEFENYSEKEIKSILKDVEATSQIVNDKLEFKAKSKNTLSDISFSIETLFGITFEGDHITFKEPTNRMFRKNKQYFLATNNGSRTKSLKEYLKNIREVDGKGRKKKINAKNVKILRTKFIIKMPQQLNLRLMAVNSSMTFNFDLESQLNVNARRTNLKFQNIQNSLNSFDVVNGNFSCNGLKGGAYKFNHVDEVRIATLESLNIDGEFSTIKIGEIGKNVEIVDFNSKFWIHNFINDFGNFKMNTEYSEINMFYPEDKKFYLETFGHDTVHYMGNNLSTEIEPSRKNESSKMLIIGDESEQNKIQIKSVHGIIRFGEDFIDYGED